ncbi:40721_t:CDS:2 [Gigaspora margarita]|uniref:40721_t:CDS:1 n=1 Tax=Gigaspora margarita TaxID=4874 RepID=A0ABN7UT24_GIGMA|nr:40721_t:CDS:2 [Gigaspora margarita]
MKCVENVDVAEIVKAIGVVSNMIDEVTALGSYAKKNINENNNLNEKVENYSIMELANIKKEYIPVVSASANVINSNRTEGDIEKKSLMIESDLKVSEHDKAIIEKMYSEEFKGSCKINKLVEEVVKALMKDKGLNDKVEKKKTDINGHNIPVIKVKNDDLAIDDNNNSVDVQDKKMKYKYWHEFNFHNEKSWSNERLNCNEKLVRDDRVKGKGMELKIYDDFDEAVMKCMKNDHGDDKRKVNVIYEKTQE